jgi:hypothetical protein
VETAIIEIPAITLCWSEWHAWADFARDARSDTQGIRVPDGPGVYEARLISEHVRLTIGRAADLRMRLKQGLVKGKIPHSAGRRIEQNEDISCVVIRFAETDFPAAVEEELHKRHKAAFGRLPKYTLAT